MRLHATSARRMARTSLPVSGIDSVTRAEEALLWIVTECPAAALSVRHLASLRRSVSAPLWLIYKEPKIPQRPVVHLDLGQASSFALLQLQQKTLDFAARQSAPALQHSPQGMRVRTAPMRSAFTSTRGPNLKNNRGMKEAACFFFCGQGRQCDSHGQTVSPAHQGTQYREGVVMRTEGITAEVTSEHAG